MEYPLIDIIVPTYNRAEEIKKFMAEIQKQTYPHFKVYIVDDCSTETIAHLIPQDDRFNYIRLDKNEGQASARNYGIEAGKGELIISMDDDAWFYNDTEALYKISDYFKDDREIGCLMFDILEPEKKWLSEQLALKDNQVIGSHITCGCTYTRKALIQINGFNGFFHSGAEETDISLRLIKNNFKIKFGDKIKVFHNYLPQKRNRKWYYQLRKNTTRNDLYIVVLHFPSNKKFIYFWGKFISHLKFSITNRQPITASVGSIAGLFQAIVKLPYLFKRKSNLTNEQFSNWLKIRW